MEIDVLVNTMHVFTPPSLAKGLAPLATAEFTQSVLKWWREVPAAIPRLKRLARIVLPWSISSAWCERLGSLMQAFYSVGTRRDAEATARMVEMKERLGFLEWMTPPPTTQ